MVPAVQLLVSAFIISLIHKMFPSDAPRLRRWPASCDEKREGLSCLLSRRMKDINLDRVLDADRGSR
jgi:hypothetical protein